MRKYTPLVLSSLITANNSASGRQHIDEAVRTTEELCRRLERYEQHLMIEEGKL